MIDTGAVLGEVPRRPPTPNPNFHLQAANRYNVTTASRTLTLHIGLGRTFQWDIAVAVVRCTIIGTRMQPLARFR